MNNLHKRRLYFIALIIIGLAVATGLILYALQKNINAFLTPGQLVAAHLPPDYALRLGGLVKKGSVVREQGGLNVEFVVTDFKHDVLVRYAGILPDLFREGKGVVAEGHVNASGVLMANQVLAKHDENYMPKNVYKALRENAA